MVMLGRSSRRGRWLSAFQNGGHRRVDSRLVSLTDARSFEADQYRALRHAVELAHDGRRALVVAVTSPVAGDGKTLTAINLAGSLARARTARVLLIDADLRRPNVARTLGEVDGAGPGLVDALLDGTGLDRNSQHVERFNLSILVGRRTDNDSYELLASGRFGELVAEARHRYEYVILDTPPLIPVPDSRLLTQWVDGLLVVIRAGKTPRQLVGAALSELDRAKVLGLVFNGGDAKHSRYAKYYYSYYHDK